MGVAMKQFIDRFKAMEKIANETLAANPEALVGVDSLPGSEHDAKVPEEAKKPDEEVAQGQPAGATSASGAVNGGDAKPLNEGKLEMDHPLLNPEGKPLITDDALTAKTAGDHLKSIVSDLLKDINEKKASATAPNVQKQAQCGGGSGSTHAATPDKKTEKKVEDGDEKKAGEKKAGEEKPVLKIDSEMLDKIAAAQAVFMAGREAAEKAIKQAEAQKKASANDPASDARAIIKAACVKAAQEAGLNPAEAEAAADNAMAAAGMAGADAGAAAADAGAADAAAADAATGAIPEDVTEEELAAAIVDLVNSGEIDADTAKALVEEIAGDSGAAAPTEDQAAEIIAQGLESGEITPEQAQQIAAAVEGGVDQNAAAAADAGAAAADAEAQGAADAEAAAQDAADEAKGAADAEAAMKEAAAAIRHDALAKIASHIVTKRNEKVEAASNTPGFRVMSKVASILEAKKAKLEKQEKKAEASDEDRYLAGFKKKAEEMGVDPAALARYVCESHKSKAK